MPIDFAQTIAGELAVRPTQVARSIELFDDDNTVPFVARYRKEVTGGLDEVQFRRIWERLDYLRGPGRAGCGSWKSRGSHSPGARSAAPPAGLG